MMNPGDAFAVSYRNRKIMSEVSGYDEDEDQTTSPDIVCEPPAPYDPDVAVGQFRTLPNGACVLVVRPWEEDGFVTVGLSEYEEQADDEEIRLGKRVYQLWNSRVIPREILAESWSSETVASEEELTRVREAWEYFTFQGLGAAQPEWWWDAVGTGVLPWNEATVEEYKSAERARMAELDARIVENL